MLEKREYSGDFTLKKEISMLLESAFPIEERPPTEYFFKALERKENKLFAYYAGEVFIGFTFLSFYQDVCYIFFLAVSPNQRGKGYGGSIIEDIKKSYPDNVILLCFEEVDAKYPNYEQRVKRKNFYYSHGFQDNKLKTNEFGVLFETAFIGKHQVSFSTYVEIFALGFGEFARNYIKQG